MRAGRQAVCMRVACVGWQLPRLVGCILTCARRGHPQPSLWQRWHPCSGTPACWGQECWQPAAAGVPAEPPAGGPCRRTDPGGECCCGRAAWRCLVGRKSAVRCNAPFCAFGAVHAPCDSSLEPQGGTGGQSHIVRNQMQSNAHICAYLLRKPLPERGQRSSQRRQNQYGETPR